MNTSARLALLARDPPWWAIVLAAALANFAAVRLTLLVPVDGGPSNIHSVMWAPTAIAFVFTWYFGRAGIVGSYLGIAWFIFERYNNPLFCLFAATGQALPTAYTIWQLRRNGITDLFASPRSILQFAVFGVVILPLLSSAFGALLTGLAPSPELHWGPLGRLALWANEAIAILLIVPVLLQLHDWRAVSRRKRLELLGLVLGIAIAWWYLFFASTQTLPLPLVTLTTPFLILIAFRFNFGIVASVSLLISILSMISLTRNPYGKDSQAFFFAITYLSSLGLSNLAVGAGSAALRTVVRKLTASEELLRGMFEQAAVGLLLYDLKANKRTCNPKFLDMLGYPMEKITDGDLRSISFPEEYKITEDFMLKMQRGEIDSFNQEKRYIRQDGNVIWTSATVSMQRDKAGAGNLLIGVFEDITPRQRIEEKLRDSEQRFRITFEQAAVGVALLDSDSNWLQVNQSFCNIVGYTREELLQERYAKLLAPEDLEHTAQSIAELRPGSASQIQIDHRYMRKSGDIIWVSSKFSVARDADGKIDYQIAVIQDITERKRAEAEIERLALYDYLTGLPNRRLFGDRLRTAIKAAKRSARFGAVIYIDLDNFKQLNDTHGHNTGDDFLKMVAHRLQRNLREEDTVARLGGDEFVILLQNVSASLPETATTTATIAEKVQRALSEPFVLPSGVEHVGTSSLGITLFPKDAESAEDLLKEADIAMYRVKETQRNAMRFYEPAMKAAADSRIALERALRRALHGDEFELYLQPQFDAERTMVSCEALLRWPQPDGGFISPNEFIPLAEETGLIVPLGEWVLRRAGKLAHALERAGHTIAIAINVSPRQFNEANFVERVRTILWEAGADSGRIMLEITEGVVVADFDDVRTKMLALRQMGIRLSIDDFGTGHSSLAYLKLLPLHELKIDRVFVNALPDDANDVAIVEAILSVAHHLQFEVVAEGVETEAQFKFLKQRGCQRFQGYLLARPAPPNQYFPELGNVPKLETPELDS